MKKFIVTLCRKIGIFFRGLFDTKQSHWIIENTRCADLIHHTCFDLCRGRGSKEVHPFPLSNFLDIPEEDQEYWRQEVAKHGFTLVTKRE